MPADASEEEWATLLEHTRYRRFGPGDAVVTAGAPDQSLYLSWRGSWKFCWIAVTPAVVRLGSTEIIIPEVVAAVTAAVKNRAEISPALVAALRRGDWTQLKEAGRVSAPAGA